MKKYKSLIISIIMLFAVFFSCVAVQATEDAAEEAAEVNAYIDGKIPSIKVTEWTPIHVTIQDAFGIDWDKLSAALPDWWMRLIWPFNPSFPQPVQRFLGYTSLRFEPEIIEGNPNGWLMRVYPSAITGTNPGNIHNITLEVQTDDSAVDYAVVIGIKCIRIDTLGGEIGSSYIYIPVKASPQNFVEMRSAETTKKAGLKSMAYFDLDITNNGYYKDVFLFELDEENGLMGLFNEQALVLKPGETKRATLGILTPEKFFDPGTPNKIDVYVYSSGDSTRTLVGSLIVYTEGIYISPLVGIILVPIIIILIIIYLLFFYSKQKKEGELFVKPEKPWNIPEERRYLEELKEKDKEEYNKVLKMMDEEYQSALLWYEDYRIAKKQKEPQKKTSSKQEKKGIFADLFKKSEKTEPKQPKEEKKPVEPEKIKEKPEIVKKQYEAINRKAEETNRKKNKALLKIKREQEKQRKKVRKLI